MVISFPVVPDSATVALQISVIHRHSKCLFHSGRHPSSCICQHFEWDITLNAWLTTCISVALEMLGKHNWAREQNWQLSAYIHNGDKHAFLLPELWCWCFRHQFFSYRFSSELWWIVINVSDSDDSSGRVWKAVHGVALHVSGLDDQSVLRHFLVARKEKAKAGLKHLSLNILESMDLLIEFSVYLGNYCNLM